MYLLVVDTKSKAKRVIYHWFHPSKNSRDMRPYLVEQLGPGAFLLKEDPIVIEVLKWAQSWYRPNVTVYKVNEPISMKDKP